MISPLKVIGLSLAIVPRETTTVYFCELDLCAKADCP